MDLCRLPGLMTQASQLAKLEPARPQIRAASVEAGDKAGILKLKVLYTVNIKMWYRPKYYKELRKRNKSDQAISDSPESRVRDSVRPGPGLKQQASSSRLQASSKPEPSSGSQASSDKL